MGLHCYYYYYYSQFLPRLYLKTDQKSALGETGKSIIIPESKILLNNPRMT